MKNLAAARRFGYGTNANSFINPNAVEGQGFEVFSICGAIFDSQGNYVDSNCSLGDPPMPGQNYYTACLESVNGCTGTACTYDPPIFN